MTNPEDSFNKHRLRYQTTQQIKAELLAGDFRQSLTDQTILISLIKSTPENMLCGQHDLRIDLSKHFRQAVSVA
jgi:hypothetical protein